MMTYILLGLALLAETGQWVIPPGREGLLIQMLDVKGLPTGCTLAGADPVKDVVQVLYTCDPTGKTSVKLELVYPEAAPKDAVRTERFGIVARTPAPPGLVDAVAAQIKQHESRFEWMHVSQASTAAPPEAKFPTLLVVAAGAVLLAAVAALVVRRNAARG